MRYGIKNYFIMYPGVCGYLNFIFFAKETSPKTISLSSSGGCGCSSSFTSLDDSFCDFDFSTRSTSDFILEGINLVNSDCFFTCLECNKV